MLGHGGSSAGSYLADPTSPIPSHCAVIILFQSFCRASIVVTGTVRVNSGGGTIMGEVCLRAHTDYGMFLSLESSIPARATLLLDSVSNAIEQLIFSRVYLPRTNDF